MNNIAVSIIVPVYNVEKYLSRCVDSLIHQSLRNIEIILVDDESPDKCPVMCDNYALADERIKVIHKKNQGLGLARNSGLEVATGVYVAYCDSDDYVKHDAYERLYEYAMRTDADVVYGSFYKEKSPNVWEEQRKNDCEQIIEGQSVKTYLLDMIACAPSVNIERRHDMSSCMSIYKRSILEDNNIRFTSERVNASEDTIYNIDFLKRTRRIGIIPFSFYFYCLNGSSLTQTFHPDKLGKFVVLRNQMIAHLGDWDLKHYRSNRFFIGYARSFVICAFKSNESNIREMMVKMVQNPVWNEIRKEYMPSYLPWTSRIIYYLTINKHVNLLVVVGWIMTKLWILRSRLKK